MVNEVVRSAREFEGDVNSSAKEIGRNEIKVALARNNLKMHNRRFMVVLGSWCCAAVSSMKQVHESYRRRIEYETF